MDIVGAQWSTFLGICLLRTACALAVRRSRRKRQMRPRRFWCREWLLKRDTLSHMPLLQEIRENNPDDFRNYLRMEDDCFLALLNLVSPLIQRQDTRMRQAVTPEQRLVVTLRFLATGRTLEDLKFSSAISAQALGVIIPDTCDAIMTVLKKDYLKVR